MRNLFGKKLKDDEEIGNSSEEEVQQTKKGILGDKKRLRYDDDNVNRAIELRNQKQKHSDFFFRLHELKEKIEVYNEIFRSKVPKFLHQDAYTKVEFISHC